MLQPDINNSVLYFSDYQTEWVTSWHTDTMAHLPKYFIVHLFGALIVTFFKIEWYFILYINAKYIIIEILLNPWTWFVMISGLQMWILNMIYSLSQSHLN